MYSIVRLQKEDKMWYLLWCDVHRAPIVPGKDRDEIFRYLYEEEHWQFHQIQDELDRLDRSPDEKFIEHIRDNCAGTNGECLEIAEIIQRFCENQEESPIFETKCSDCKED